MKFVNNKQKQLNNRLNNKGTTMIELIITVAIVAVFFGAVAVAVPKCLEQYIMMKETSEALEITSILENGLAAELGSAGRISFNEETGISYVKNGQNRYFPIKKGVTEDTNYDYDIKLKIDGSERILRITGQPKSYGTLYDIGFYGNMTVEMTLDYVPGNDCINLQVVVFNSEGKSIATTNKPIILYNRQ